jgi:hypothetical protein
VKVFIYAAFLNEKAAERILAPGSAYRGNALETFLCPIREQRSAAFHAKSRPAALSIFLGRLNMLRKDTINEVYGLHP